MSFLRIPSIFRRSKSTSEHIPKEAPSTFPCRVSSKEETTSTIKDVFPVTRYATHSSAAKKQLQWKKEKSPTTTTTTNPSVVPKRKSPRKKKIDTTFRSALRNENNNNNNNNTTQSGWTQPHTPPTNPKNSVEEGVATAAAAKLLLEASQRMQDQESVDSRWTASNAGVKASSQATPPLEPPPTCSSSDKVTCHTRMEYLLEILKRQEDIYQWQQVMLNFLASATDFSKDALEHDKKKKKKEEGETEQQPLPPWEQLLQEQKKQLVVVKECIEKAKNME